MPDEPCDSCGTPAADALIRTIRLSVDRSNIDTQLLCPDYFADWIERYEQEMMTDSIDDTETDSDIIVD